MLKTPEKNGKNRANEEKLKIMEQIYNNKISKIVTISRLKTGNFC